jgi:hypothetical protein
MAIVFWNVTLYSMVEVYRHFRGIYSQASNKESKLSVEVGIRANIYLEEINLNCLKVT